MNGAVICDAQRISFTQAMDNWKLPLADEEVGRTGGQWGWANECSATLR